MTKFILLPAVIIVVAVICIISIDIEKPSVQKGFVELEKLNDFTHPTDGYSFKYPSVLPEPEVVSARIRSDFAGIGWNNSARIAKDGSDVVTVFIVDAAEQEVFETVIANEENFRNEGIDITYEIASVGERKTKLITMTAIDGYKLVFVPVEISVGRTLLVGGRIGDKDRVLATATSVRRAN